MKNIVVLVMSTFNDNPRQTLVKSDAGEFRTIHTNETSIRYIEKTLPKGERINKIYVLTTEAVRKCMKDDLKYRNISEKARELSHFECFKNLLNCKEEFYPIKVDKENGNEAKNYYKQFRKSPTEKVKYSIKSIKLEEDSKAFLNCLYQILQELRDNNFDKETTNIHIDTTGGFRYTAMIMLTLSQLLNYNGYNLSRSKMLYSKYDMDKNTITVEDINPMTNLFTLVGGANDFAMFGNTAQLKNFFRDRQTNNKHVVFKKVLTSMENFSEAIKRCVYHDYVLECLFELKDSVLNFKKKYENQYKNNDIESAFNMLLPRIEEEYKSILPIEESLKSLSSDKYKYMTKIINWCCAKKFVQQALTFYTEWIPIYLLNQKVVLTNKKIKATCEKSRQSYDPWEKEFFKSYALDCKNIKSNYTEEEYREIVEEYSELIKIRNEINHAHTDNISNFSYEQQNEALLSRIEESIKLIDKSLA